MVAITRPLRSAPTAGLEVMLGWIPLPLHIKEVGMNTYMRIRDSITDTWDGLGIKGVKRGHLSTWESQVQEVIPQGMPILSFDEKIVWVEKSKSKGITSESLEIFTDASKEGEFTGYGWAVCKGNYVLAEGNGPMGDITVHHAEIMAIKEVLSWLKENTPNKSKEWTDVHIWSDSRSAVHSLNNYKTRDPIVEEVLLQLKEINSLYSVEVLWVKGHSSITGNELADCLAKQGLGMAEKCCQTNPYFPLSKGMIKTMLRGHAISAWQKYWDDLRICRISRCFYPEVKTDRNTIKMPITELSALSQIITGHGLYKDHIRHWNDIEDYSCSLCKTAPEDSWHLWSECNGLTKERSLKDNRHFEKTLLQFFKSQKLKALVARNECLLSPS